MVMCSVYGCGHRSGRDGGLVRFYAFPAVTKYTTTDKIPLVLSRRSLWLLRICRQDLDDAKAAKQYARVCSHHFVSGVPAALEDTSNIDWAPSLHMGHDFFDGKRKLRKRKKEISPKCQCDTYVACTKYRKKYKRSLKKKITGDDDDDDTPYANKYACCVMHDNFDKGSQFEESMSSSESTTSDTSESSNNFKDCSLATIKSEDACSVTSRSEEALSIHISDEVYLKTVKSEDNFSDDSDDSESVQKEKLYEIPDEYSQKHFSKLNSGPKTFDASGQISCVTHPEYAYSEENLSTHISADVDSKTKIATESEDNFSDDNEDSESVQMEKLYEIPDKCTQKQFSKLTPEPKTFDASGQISCVTHPEAFFAAETLLRYIMNQDEVNDVGVNFILNLAQKIKERIN